ncbi:MAG: S9 family peptidase [Acidobacteria bacterium]|nr:S9 family peptidase [Acidobacteriota bacterium]
MSAPPKAPRIPVTCSKHGVTWCDPFAWLKQRENPSVLEHLKAENAYTASIMAPHRLLQKEIYQELVGRMAEDDVSVPVPFGPFAYATREVAGCQYPVLFRMPRDGGAEEVLLDVNKLAEAHDYFDLGFCLVSPSHQLMAYAVDTLGEETYDIYFRDLANDCLLPDVITGVAANMVWGADSQSVYYVCLDQVHRPFRLMRHELGGQKDAMIAEELDRAFVLSVGKTEDDAFITMCRESQTTSHISCFPAETINPIPFDVQPRCEGVEYGVSHWHGHWLIMTNESAPNFKLELLIGDSRETWLGHRSQVLLEDYLVFKDHVVTLERVHGVTQVWVTDEARQRRQVTLPGAVYDVDFEENPEWNAPAVRLSYSSPICPDRVLSVDLVTLEIQILKEREVRGGFDASRYLCHRDWAISSDGTKVPLTIIERPDRVQSTTIMHGYGAYGISLEARFSSARLSLLDRGVRIVLAHVRGGSEMGRAWYDAGKLAQKHHSFEDFIACAEALKAKGLADRLVVHGGSAGGLLVGAALNLRPELFQGVIALVPFVDVLNTMLDPDLPLTEMEYEEWGNPNDPDVFHRIRSYAPYEQLQPHAFPTMWVTAGISDPRVGYWEPAKWVARIRELQTNDKPILLKTELGAGHYGATGRYDALHEIAEEYTFALIALHLLDSSPR